jgi:hypothetical protein
MFPQRHEVEVPVSRLDSMGRRNTQLELALH